MDLITKSILRDFVAEHSLEKLEEDAAFEHLTAYLVTSQHDTEKFSTSDIVIGNGGDGSIDSIAIIVNGRVISELEEVTSIEDGYLDVSFVFNQAKRTASFDGSVIGDMLYGIVDFFSEKPKIPLNDEAARKAEITRELLRQATRFKRGKPQCFLYYCTTGRWEGDVELEGRRASAIADLQRLNLFRKVEFEMVDSDRLQKLDTASKNAISAEISFPNKIPLPELTGIAEAYLGLLSAREYLKLIENTDEEVIRPIFYDNVRQFEDWNDVNKGILETLQSDKDRPYFPLFNNGITIIAKRMVTTGNKVFIEDYSVVNGCQTSNVLHEARALLGPEVLLPIRLIATSDPLIKNAIIRGTNRQTAVSEEEFYALEDLPKKLERYFAGFEDATQRLYYERQSRQYAGAKGIQQVRIIDLAGLVRAYASIFLDFPHRTTRNYRGLLKAIKSEFFDKDNVLEMYYASAFAYYRLDFLFRRGEISAELKPARYHILFLFRLLTKPDLPKWRNSREMKKYCEELMTSLWDENLSKARFIRAAEIARAAVGAVFDRDSRDRIRTEPFTEKVRELALNEIVMEP